MYLSISETAKILNLSIKATRRYIASGQLVATSIKGVYRVKKQDIDRFLKENQALHTVSAKETTANEKKPLESQVDKRVTYVDISTNWTAPPKAKLSFVDVFCGAGGLSLGLEWAGFQGIAGLDWFDAATHTYASNFKHPIINGDVTDDAVKQEFYDLVKETLQGRELDLVAGGFPCQGFSMAGHRIVDDPRNSLYKELLEIVAHLRPRFLLFENVKGIRSMLKGGVVRKIVADVETLGYTMQYETLMAADYYTPQKRERVLFIGNRVDAPILFPRPLLDATNYVTTGQAIGDLTEQPHNPSLNHLITKHSPEMIERLRAVKPGSSLYKNYSDAWKRCVWSEPSSTIKENHGGVNIHPTLPRVLTPREMARLQSFPDSFLFKGTKSEQLVQIGNAVPPLLSKAVGLAIIESNKLTSK